MRTGIIRATGCVGGVLMSKRAWKPLNLPCGLRLYRVTQSFPNHPEWKREFVVVAQSPTHARKLVEEAHKGGQYSEEPFYDGSGLNVYQPAEWWEEGMPCFGDLKCEARTGKR